MVFLVDFLFSVETFSLFFLAAAIASSTRDLPLTDAVAELFAGVPFDLFFFLAAAMASSTSERERFPEALGLVFAGLLFVFLRTVFLFYHT